MAAVALVGTLDTKGPDFAFLASRLRAAGAEVIVVDVGTGEPDGLTPDIDGDAVAAAAGTTRPELRQAADRGRAVTEMGRGAASVIADLVAHGRVGGVLAAGGSGGSSIAAQVMAALPVGLPKLLVSTMASGDVSPYVGAKDVCRRDRGAHQARRGGDVQPGLGDDEVVRVPGAANSQGEVIANPGQGHARHLHERADELIYVISGTGTQTVGDEEFPITEGDTVYIPMGTMHSTLNTGWRTLRLIVTYTPGGEEQALTALPDFTRHPASEIVTWQRAKAGGGQG